jgi:hypothetical protein
VWPAACALGQHLSVLSAWLIQQRVLLAAVATNGALVTSNPKSWMWGALSSQRCCTGRSCAMNGATSESVCTDAQNAFVGDARIPETC